MIKILIIVGVIALVLLFIRVDNSTTKAKEKNPAVDVTKLKEEIIKDKILNEMYPTE